MVIFKGLRKYVIRHRVFVISIAVSLIGASLLIFTIAATPSASIEAEKGTLSVNAKANVNSNASAGGYVRFQKPTTTTSTQRFPGDPNPLVSGKAYWGANVTALLADGTKTSDVNARHEKPTGKPFPLYHTYHQWGAIDSGSMVSRARTDHTAGRLPYLTFKTNGDWAAIGKGTYDAQLDKLIRELDALGKPVWVTVHHEPENDLDSSTRTRDSWKAMQTRFKLRMNAANNGAGTKNIAFMPHLMDWTFNPSSGREPEKWWVSGIWDVVMISNYCDSKCIENGSNSLKTKSRADAVAFLENKKMPWGLGEWSLSEKRTGPLKFTAVISEYWNWGFINKKDVVAYSYFDADESRPDPNSPYYATLRDASLDAFHTILRSDTRVQRINELK
jgi:hypothetical protein